MDLEILNIACLTYAIFTGVAGMAVLAIGCYCSEKDAQKQREIEEQLNKKFRSDNAKIVNIFDRLANVRSAEDTPVNNSTTSTKIPSFSTENESSKSSKSSEEVVIPI